MTEYQLNKNIICIDLKSFYASVECSIRRLDPFDIPLVVADKSRGDNALCLSVTPFLKDLGVSPRTRISLLPKIPNKEIVYAKPRMKTYMEYSLKVIEIYLKYVSDDDLYVYSIDEAFLDVTNYLKLYKMTDYELAKTITDDIKKTLDIYSSCGIGPNMLLAKLSMDLDAKNMKNGIAKWHYDDVSTKLWPVVPLSKMWGIGYRMEKNLNKLGLYSVGDVANFPKERLKKQFGIMGEELWYHTHGIDMSLVQDKYKLKRSNKSLSQMQVLFHDYYVPDIYVIIAEMADEVVRRLRFSKKQGKTIQLYCGYNKEGGSGFSKQVSLDQPTESYTIFHDALLKIFNQFYDGVSGIRYIGVGIGSLTENTTYQYSVFEDAEKLEKENRLLKTVDSIKLKHGKNKINRASSLEESSTIIERNKLIGGHHE